MSTMTVATAHPLRQPYAARPASARPYAALPRPAGQLRLTRRGRFAVFLLALLLVLAAWTFLGARTAATGEHGGTPTPTERMVVAPGDTLWAIAAERADDGEVRAMVDQIEEINALDSAMLYAGQVLFVPVAD